MFVTPCWQRYDLTRLCLEQRRHVCDHLAEHGIDATCVVIADDDNLDVAREFGFATVERDNEWLSRRFNDGYAYAAKAGADFICPIGSDSWIDPRLLEVLPEPNQMQVSRNYSVVREDGRALARLAFRTPLGYSCWVIPTAILRPFQYRPCEENLERGCDGSLFRALASLNPPLTVFRHERGPFDIVAFRSEVQITPYERLVSRHGGRQLAEPFTRLKRRYPADLVDRAERFHQERMVAA